MSRAGGQDHPVGPARPSGKPPGAAEKNLSLASRFANRLQGNRIPHDVVIVWVREWLVTAELTGSGRAPRVDAKTDRGRTLRDRRAALLRPLAVGVATLR